MKVKNVQVYGLEESILRSSYPMQIHEPYDFYDFEHPGYSLLEDINGEAKELDLKRAKKLADTPSGTGHDNFLKGIIVQFDLQYPEYFSPQLQRYNWIDIISSQSKMHKITSRKLTKGDFAGNVRQKQIDWINSLIHNYNEPSPDKDYQKELFQNIIANLPSGYLKWMGISTNYLQLKTIYQQRSHHKLEEWDYFCDWIETLPMGELITGKNE